MPITRRPAFPVHMPSLDGCGGGSLTYLGMSLRGYLAARAPDMPSWWEYDEPKPKMRLTHLGHHLTALCLTKEEDRRLLDWWCDQSFDLDDELASKAMPVLEMFEEQTQKNAADMSAWQMRRMVAWRWAYADAMLAVEAE